jgi:PAS domain S-box-containing protein
MNHKATISFIWIVCLIIISPCFGNDLKLQLTSDEKRWLNQDHTVRVRIGSAPPFLLTDGRIRGMAIDYLTYVFNQHGIKIQYIQESEVSWPQALKYIEEHDVVDMVPTAKITDERKKRMIFTDEYIFAPWVIFTRSKADFIGSVEDLKGKTVSVEEGFVIHEKLKRDYPEIKLKIVSAKLPNYAEIPVRDLSSGLVDAYIGNLIMTTYMIQSKGYTNIKVAAPTPFGNHNQAMAMRSDWPELASIINKTLAGMTPDEHATILNRWLSIRYEYGINKTDVIKWVSGIAGIAVLFILSVLIWNRRLKNEVIFRKNMQLQIQEKEKALRLSLDAAKAGTWTWDIKTGEVIWDNRMQAIFGIEPGMFDGTFDAWKKRVHPDDLQAAEKATVDALEHEKGYEHEYRVKGTLGEWRIINAQAATLIDDKGKPIMMSGFAMDITERKRVEKALREKHLQLQAILDHSPALISIKDMEGTIILANRNFEVLDIPPLEEFIGKNVFELFPKEVAKDLWQNDLMALEKDGSIEVEEIVSHKDGTLHAYLTIKFPLYFENREPFGICAISTDITDRKKMEARLLQAQKMESIGTLAGGIAHDFNNIMAIILGNTELALDDIPKWNSAHSSLEEIKQASLRAKNIVKQLLSFSRKTDQELQPIQIASVIKDALKFLRSTIPTTINIHQDIQTTDETILADPTQINQIIMNLCINASHAMEQTGGDLNVTVAKVIIDDNSTKDYPDLKSGDHVKIMVSDTGPGIDHKIIDQIFDPYFTTKEVGKGSGMGLAVVHGIVKNHNGAIAVDSNLGKGTKFIIFFPLAKGKPVVEAHTTKDIPGGDETILFVDDEISIVKMVKRMFERLGYKIETATTPQEALDRFSLNPDHFDLVITDMTMPQMTGVKLSKKLMDIRKDIPIIVCTGHSTLVDEEKAKELGLAAYVMKPIDMQETAQTIRKVLDKK